MCKQCASKKRYQTVLVPYESTRNIYATACEAIKFVTIKSAVTSSQSKRLLEMTTSNDNVECKSDTLTSNFHAKISVMCHREMSSRNVNVECQHEMST